jgi:hypothetical protein
MAAKQEPNILILHDKEDQLYPIHFTDGVGVPARASHGQWETMQSLTNDKPSPYQLANAIICNKWTIV